MHSILHIPHFWAALLGLQFLSLILSNFNYYHYLFKFDKNILATNVYHFMSNKVGSSIGIRLIEKGEGGRSMFDNDAKYVNLSYIFNLLAPEFYI
jgi:hypothetical protein